MKTLLSSARDVQQPLSFPRSCLSPEKELILYSLMDPELLSVQIETVWLNMVNTNNLVENLLQMVFKFTEEVQELRKDNE
jgi:hypothetical protein